MSIAPPSLELPTLDGPSEQPTKGARPRAQSSFTIALVGNPNAGKTTLFNRLTGLRAKTANFAGTTVEYRRADVTLAGRTATLIDLPGLYSLEAATPDEQIACDAIAGKLHDGTEPDLVLVVLDATNLERNLFLAGQVLELGLPTVATVNMIDAAERQGLAIDAKALTEQLGCAVVTISARTGAGVDRLIEALTTTARPSAPPVVPPELAACRSCAGCQYAARYDWAERVSADAVSGDASAHGRRTEAIDRVLTHPVVGLALFAAVMTLVFVLIFSLAQYPMDMIAGGFELAEKTVGRWLPEGLVSSLATDGVLAGFGSVIVFLPQICLLFFMLALLEDTGYMARAAFVMDRLMHRVGLPGKAFVPMLSAHACAIPAIMSTRVIEDRRDRLATILVIPLMTCSARLPIYALVMAMLFPHEPVRAALLFAGAYGLGIVAALAMAWVYKHSLLKGRTKPLVIELPHYHVPSLRNAFLLTYDRAMAFVKTAGTTILTISLVMWALATFPRTEVADLPPAEQSQIAALLKAGDQPAADRLLQQAQLENSFAGKTGRLVEPVFAPLGFDWRTSVGVLTSFAAREVVVSTLSILYGLGEDGAETRLPETLRDAKRADGSPAFTTAVCLSMLVFYVLAMQCLSTQAVTRRETGSWRWPMVQLGSMTLLAYAAAFVTYQVASHCGL